MPNRISSPTEGYQQLETLLVKQLLEASGAFKGSGASGSDLRMGMFVEALADAVVKSGGFGLAAMLEKQLGSANEGAPAASGAWDDPNSDVPLPDGYAAPDPGQAAGSTPGPRAAAAPLPNGPRPAPAFSLTPYSGGEGEIETRVTSGFGTRVHPLDGQTKFHTGVDLAAAPGSRVRAVADGVVKEAGPRGAYGNVVEIAHPDGSSTLYAHNASLLVKTGDPVTAGEPIALAGSTGRVTGPHLHFELRQHDHPVDPQKAVSANLVARALIKYRDGADAEDGVKSEKGVPPRAGVGP
jgi:murein DD-endopeptidase MepM/ murein hydrolase activator NlpD